MGVPLLEVLDRLGVAKSSDLVSLLGISQPQLSRLLAAASASVCRVGKGRATRYARNRQVEGLGTELPLHQVDEAGSLHEAGVLHLLSGGRHWLLGPLGEEELFAGLPPFASDMSPQGYLGRSFPARHRELGLPPSINDWNDDHRLISLARRGEDGMGNLILGTESLDRFLASELHSSSRADYLQLAARSADSHPGSSAGGEQPKFTALVEGRHVLVKFAGSDPSPAAQRWRDLLWCEHLALGLLKEKGVAAASSQCVFIEGHVFLELERFDRVGARGRRGMVSLAALDDEYFGFRDTWTQAALRLLAAKQVTDEDARTIRWLDTFGNLMGNTDRHFGNLSFLLDAQRNLTLAPVYDMLPMFLAPVGANLSERMFEPRPPSAQTLDVWHDAASTAVLYWERVAASEKLSPTLRQRVQGFQETLSQLIQRAPRLA